MAERKKINKSIKFLTDIDLNEEKKNTWNEISESIRIIYTMNRLSIKI